MVTDFIVSDEDESKRLTNSSSVYHVAASFWFGLLKSVCVYCFIHGGEVENLNAWKPSEVEFQKIILFPQFSKFFPVGNFLIWKHSA